MLFFQADLVAVSEGSPWFVNPLDEEEDEDDTAEEKAAKAARLEESRLEEAALRRCVEAFFTLGCRCPPALFSENMEGSELFLETWGAEAEGGFSCLFSVNYDKCKVILQNPSAPSFSPREEPFAPPLR